MSKIFAGLTGILAIVLILFATGLLAGLPIMWLWNGIIPSLFGLGKIGYLQAVGLYYLCGLLFKSITTKKD